MIRRLAIAGVLAAASSGCATTWMITQASGTARVWDEGVREQVVPLPGIEERLTVTMPLTPEYEPRVGGNQAGTVATAPLPPKPFALGCSTSQRGRDVVYHSAYRYGSTWKKSTAAAIVIEGVTAALLLLVADNKADNTLAGGLFAIDALGTAILLFAPRKEILDPIVIRRG